MVASGAEVVNLRTCCKNIHNKIIFGKRRGNGCRQRNRRLKQSVVEPSAERLQLNQFFSMERTGSLPAARELSMTSAARDSFSS